MSARPVRKQCYPGPSVRSPLLSDLLFALESRAIPPIETWRTRIRTYGMTVRPPRGELLPARRWAAFLRHWQPRDRDAHTLPHTWRGYTRIAKSRLLTAGQC